MFKRPTIARLYEVELYEARRMLIDAEAKRDHAKTLLGHHEVNVGMLKERIERLQAATPTLTEVIQGALL